MFPASAGKPQWFRPRWEIFGREQRLRTDLRFTQRCAFLIAVYYWAKTSGRPNNGKGRALLSNYRIISTFSTPRHHSGSVRWMLPLGEQCTVLSASPHVCSIGLRWHGKEEGMPKEESRDPVYSGTGQPTSFSLCAVNVKLRCWRGTFISTGGASQTGKTNRSCVPGSGAGTETG